MYCDHRTFLQAVQGAQAPGIAEGFGGALVPPMDGAINLQMIL